MEQIKKDVKFLDWFFYKYPDEYKRYYKEWSKKGKPEIE